MNFFSFFVSPMARNSDWRQFVDYKVILPLIARLPYPLAFRLARVRGRAVLSENFAACNDIVANLRRTFPQEEEDCIGKIAVEIFENASLEEMEAARIARHDKKFINKYVSIKGTEHLEKAFQAGRGVIFVSLHHGSYISVFSSLAKHVKEKIYMVVGDYTKLQSRHHRSFIKKKIDGVKYFLGGGFFFVGKIDKKKSFDVLSANGAELFVFDSPLGAAPKFEFEYLGHQVHFPCTAIKLAHASGAAIVPVSSYRRPGGKKIQGEVFPPVWVENEMQHEQILQNVICMLEKNILRYPDEFFYWTSPTSWRTIDQL